MASSSHTDPALLVEDGWPVSEDGWSVVSTKSRGPVSEDGWSVVSEKSLGPVSEDGWSVVSQKSHWSVVSAKSHQFEPPADPLYSVVMEPVDPLVSVTKEPEQVAATCLPGYQWCSKCLRKWETATGKEVPSRMTKPSIHNKFFKAIICPACVDKSYKIVYTQ